MMTRICTYSVIIIVIIIIIIIIIIKSSFDRDFLITIVITSFKEKSVSQLRYIIIRQEEDYV
jgi:hypothetical protein